MPKITFQQVLMAVLVIVLYFGVWRQIRVAINQKVLVSATENALRGRTDLNMVNRGPNSPGMTFYQPKEGSRPIEIGFKLSGGMFLLFSTVALAVFGKLKPFFIYLISLHGMFLVLCVSSLFMGLYLTPQALYFSDILSNYLEPGLSMLVVLWGIFGGKVEERGSE